VINRLRSWLVATLGRIESGSPYRVFVKKAFLHREFKKVASEFLLEVGVLSLVFPILDTIVQFGTRAVTTRMALTSIGIGFGCLWMAGILSYDEKPEDKK